MEKLKVGDRVVRLKELYDVYGKCASATKGTKGTVEEVLDEKYIIKYDNGVTSETLHSYYGVNIEKVPSKETMVCTIVTMDEAMRILSKKLSDKVTKEEIEQSLLEYNEHTIGLPDEPSEIAQLLFDFGIHEECMEEKGSDIVFLQVNHEDFICIGDKEI